MSDIDAMERCIRNARAVNQSFVDSINRHIEEATTRFTDAGMSLTFARKLAERSVVDALNDVAAEIFRGPRL